MPIHGADLGPPNYEGLKGPKRAQLRRLVGFLLGREGARATFSEIQRATGAKKSTLETRISALRRLGLIEGEKRAPISLRFKTPLCFLAGTPGIPYAYLGLLGMRESRSESETEAAVGLLERELGARFEAIAVLTTREASGSWAGSMGADLENRMETIHLDVKSMGDILAVEERMRPKLVELAKSYNLVMDCTSGLRPAGIAYYRLALEYGIPLVYVYEEEGRIFWLRSKEDLRREFRELLEVEAPID